MILKSSAQKSGNSQSADMFMMEDDKMDVFLHKNLSMCRFMPEVSGRLHIFLSLFSLWEALAGPSQPRIAPDENHDWSSVGILKGPQLGVHGSACSSPFCMRASAGVLNPSSARLSLTRRLDSPHLAMATCIICKREAEEERDNEEEREEMGTVWREQTVWIHLQVWEWKHLKDGHVLKETYKVNFGPKCLQGKLTINKIRTKK